MTFEIEVNIRTSPIEGCYSQVTEVFTIQTEANTYHEAQEHAFTTIKQSSSFEDCMNKTLK